MLFYPDSMSHSFLHGSPPPPVPCHSFPLVSAVDSGTKVLRGKREAGGPMKPQIHPLLLFHHAGQGMTRFLVSACQEENSRRQKLAEKVINSYKLQTRIQVQALLQTPVWCLKSICSQPLLLQKGWCEWNTQLLWCWLADDMITIRPFLQARVYAQGRRQTKKREISPKPQRLAAAAAVSLGCGREPLVQVHLRLEVLQTPHTPSCSSGCFSSRSGLSMLLQLLASVSKLHSRRMGFAPHSKWKRWKYKMKDLSLLSRPGRQSAKSLSKAEMIPLAVRILGQMEREPLGQQLVCSFLSKVYPFCCSLLPA